MNGETGTAGVIAPPPLLLLISLVAGFVLSWLAPLGILAEIPPDIRQRVGGVVVVLALTISMLGFTKFTRERTPVNPTRSPTHLVMTGIFARIRNPMYLVFYILSLGLAIAFAAD